MICVAFFAFNLLISLKTSLTLTPQKQKPDRFLAFLMVMILGWFLYLSITLKIGWRIFSVRGLESLNSGILRLFAAIEKEKFKI